MKKAVCIILLCMILSGFASDRFNIKSETRTATFVVAASDSSAKCRASADYVCDGTADHVQIQAAIDALPAVGGVVALTEGTFNIGVAAATTGIVLDDNVELRMATGSTLKAVVGVADNMLIISADTKSGIKITGGTLDGQSASQTQTDGYQMYGIKLNSCTYCIIDGVEVKNIGSAAWDNLGTNHDNIELYGYSGYGIYLNASSYNKITHCRLHGCGRENFVVYNGSEYNIISDNHNYDAVDRGFVIHTAHYNVFTGNQIYNNGGRGIDVAGAEGTESYYNIISNNVIKFNGHTGSTTTHHGYGGIVLGTYAFQTVVSNNYLLGNGSIDTGGTYDNGVTVFGDYSSITGNVLDKVTYQIYGIRIQSGGNYNTVVGNTCTGYDATHGINDGGTGNVVRSNYGCVTYETGTGNVVLQTTPTLTTPVLGAATATSINKVAITAPATASTLTITDGKTLTVSETATILGNPGYSITLVASSLAAPAENTIVYWGSIPLIPSTTKNLAKVYIPKAGTIKAAYIHTYSSTAGTAENISAYIRLNDTDDTLIATVGAAASDRCFSNTGLAITVAQGNFLEIKMDFPDTWETDPLTMRFGGILYIE